MKYIIVHYVFLYIFVSIYPSIHSSTYLFNHSFNVCWIFYVHHILSLYLILHLKDVSILIKHTIIFSNIYLALLCAGRCAKYFTCIVIFNLSRSYRCRNWSLDVLNNLPKIMNLVELGFKHKQCSSALVLNYSPTMPFHKSF